VTVLEALNATLIVFCAFIFIIVVPYVGVDLADKLLDKHRRKKHPEYFKFYDKATVMSFKRGAEYARRKEYFDYKFKLYNDGLRDGECTNEHYTEKMQKLMVEYQELCSWFREAEKEIRELLVQADLYAKEHDLLWGIIYDSKRT
jgi:hypothetical protein